MSARITGWPNECASEGCDQPPAVHFIRGNIGSYYCRECYMRIQKGETERLGRLAAPLPEDTREDKP